MTELPTIDLIFQNLTAKRIADVCNVRVSATYNWKPRKRFPARTIKPLQAELAAHGFTAPDSLWGIKQ